MSARTPNRNAVRFTVRKAQVTNPDYRLVHAAADRHENRLARLVARAIRHTAEQLDLADVRALLEQGLHSELARQLTEPLTQPDPIEVELAKAVGDDTAGVILDIQSEAAQAVAAGGFNVVNPRAVDRARQQAAELVTAITEETREAIRHTITRSVGGELTVDQSARLIRSVAGLNTRQASGIATLAGTLRADGAAQSRIDRQLDRGRRRAINDRARLIARTETMAAANRGVNDVWAQQAANGTLPPGWQRQWVVTPDDRLCPRCAPLAGVVVEAFDPFTEVDPRHAGRTVDVPPLHPACRCVLSLTGIAPPSRAPRPPTPEPPQTAPIPEPAIPEMLPKVGAVDPARSDLAARVADIIRDTPDWHLDPQLTERVGGEIVAAWRARMGWQVSDTTEDLARRRRQLRAQLDRGAGDDTARVQRELREVEERLTTQAMPEVTGEIPAEVIEARTRLAAIEQRFERLEELTERDIERLQAELDEAQLALRRAESRARVGEVDERASVRALVDTLSDVRDMGGDIMWIGDEEVGAMLDRASSRLPADWISRANDVHRRGRSLVATGERRPHAKGWYQPATGEINVDTTLASLDGESVALHELTHRLQMTTHTDLHAAEQVYLEWRTRGDAEAVRDPFVGGQGWVWRDEWADSYAGYSHLNTADTRRAQEVITRAVEYAHVDPTHAMYDGDSARWVLGLLAAMP